MIDECDHEKRRRGRSGWRRGLLAARLAELHERRERHDLAHDGGKERLVDVRGRRERAARLAAAVHVDERHATQADVPAEHDVDDLEYGQRRLKREEQHNENTYLTRPSKCCAIDAFTSLSARSWSTSDWMVSNTNCLMI